jgi:tetratricopeptide (TPR) repeat protein
MPRVALSMIVRNEGSTLRRCLDSVRGVAHEIVIADTGSTDDTPVIAREYGARLIQVPWEDDFARARNHALQEVQCEWILSLDADELLDPSAAPEIAAITAAPDAAGYLVAIRNYVLRLDDHVWDRPAMPNDSPLPEARAYPAYVDHENVRLFRRDPRIFFVGRVHESVGPQIEACGLALRRASFRIHHFGLAADAPTRARKNRLYRALGQRKVREMPRNAQAHLELGLVELENFDSPREALACFERACRLKPGFGVAWFFAGLAHFRLGQFRSALRCLHEAEKQGHATAFVEETIGDAHYNLGQFAESRQAYERALALAPSASLESKSGLASARAGSAEEGLQRVRGALEQRSDLPELHDRLIVLLAWLGRSSEAALAAEGKLRAVTAAPPGDFARAAHLWAGQGNWARATAVLHVGLQLYAGDPILTQSLGDLVDREGAGVNQLVTALDKTKVRTSRD